MKPYNYILLDWDGNLARTLQIWLDSTILVLKRHNFKHSNQEVINGISDLHIFFTRLGIKNVQELVDEIKLEVEMLLPRVELYPDALYVLETLHSRGKRLALITSSHRHLVVPPLKRFHLTDLFEVIITRDDVKKVKPNPEAINKALKELVAPKDQTVMIGDGATDLGAAQNSGIDSILFYSQEHEIFYDIGKLKSYNPTYIVSDFRHILDIIG